MSAAEALIEQSGLSEGARADILCRHAEPHRRYHDLTHIDALACEAARLDWIDPQPVRLAILYHDIVYRPGSATNEADSAAHMRAQLSGHIPAHVLERAGALIKATAAHAWPDAGDRDALRFLDIDMGILGSPREDYARYARQVRAEFTRIPKPLYNRGRSRVLAGFLDRERLYLSETYHARLDAPARANMRWELETALGRPGKRAARKRGGASG